MIVDKIFLQEVAKRKIHTFISTGMSDQNHIENAVQIFRQNSCPFELMHCVSTYPMKTEDANLETINFLGEFDCDVGYSGHERARYLCGCYVFYFIFRKTRNVDRSMYGSDQSASLEPRGQKELISVIQKILTQRKKYVW